MAVFAAAAAFWAFAGLAAADSLLFAAAADASEADDAADLPLTG